MLAMTIQAHSAMTLATGQNRTESSGTPYRDAGGDEGVSRIANAFYDIVERDPEMAALRALHAEDLTGTRQALYEFLSFWLGGPPLYQRNPKRGCIMSAHAHVAIDAAVRDQWLCCMRRALIAAGVPEAVCRRLDGPFARMAEVMRNS